ncbi:MAG: hypothetical protein FJ272_17320, partial [Planctomycetes bacterium]|nr:hypothetical protein [Planctomycetota bacterium]
TETIRAFYELSRRTGDMQYRQAAERYLSYFLERCQSPTTGLLAWGEHTFWNLAFDAVDRDIHEFLVWLPLWPEMWELDAPAVRRAIEGIYAHHVFDKKTGLFDRHASYSNARAVLGKKSGMPWIKHAGLMAYSLAFLYGKTGESLYLDRAQQMANLYWKTRDPQSGLPIGCIGYSEQPGSGGTAQCEALLAASTASGRGEFRDMALAYLSAAAKRTPQDPNAAASVSWALSYGDDGGAFRNAQYMLHGCVATGDPDMLRHCEFIARGIAANPPTPQAIAEAYGRAIRFLAGLSRATGKAEYRDQARALADAAIERLWHEPSGLFRGMVGYEYYDAQFGIGDLLMGLLDLDESPYARAEDALRVELSDPGIPSGVSNWPLKLTVVNSGRQPATGTLRVELPAGWQADTTTLPFDVPAAAPGADLWLAEPGRAALTLPISTPATAKRAAAGIAFVLATQSFEKRTVANAMLMGETATLKGPFASDAHTVVLAHFDKSAEPDHLQGATWKPNGVQIVPDGFFGSGAKLPDDKAFIQLTFPDRVPPEGTVEFFVKPDWSSTPDPTPASDGVIRHIFAWAPMTKDAMLWVYFLDELGAYTGVRVHGPHGKPNLTRNVDFKQGEWHHLALCWKTRADGGLELIHFVDGIR